MGCATPPVQERPASPADDEAFAAAFEPTFPSPVGDAGRLVVSWLKSPLGPMLVAAVDEGVCLAEFSSPATLGSHAAALRKLFGVTPVAGEHRHLEQLRHELNGYFGGSLTDFRVPLVYPGSRFQRAVWDRLRQVPYGATLSYEALACDLGMPGAQRAVGAANGRNRIAVVIPCHRVVNKSGRLGGYGGGLWRKQWLLDLERRVSSHLGG